jgi:hypothetical protein
MGTAKQRDKHCKLVNMKVLLIGESSCLAHLLLLRMLQQFSKLSIDFIVGSVKHECETGREGIDPTHQAFA